jgi:hypothetical protein
MTEPIVRPLELSDVLRVLAQQSDFVEALTTAANLEQWLEALLKTHMRKLSNTRTEEIFRGYGPPTSFSAKIAISHAFELIDDVTRSDLLVIKGIRNKFAHSKTQPHFESSEVDKIQRGESPC